MAKGTKKKKPELTIEEKLEQALVPEEEWPYEVPENWCWVYLSKLYEINPKINADDELDAAFVPMGKITAGNIGDFEYDIQPWGKARKGHTQFSDGDIAFAKISPCFENGKSMIIKDLPNGIGGGTTELIILRQPMVNQLYTFRLISTDDFVRRGCQTYSGTVGQQRISMDFVRNYPVPLPPLAEQQRIVNRIDSLFAKLDEAKEKAQVVVDGFDDRKAAILHKAFSGELTKHWRDLNHIDEGSWEFHPLSAITDNHDSKRIPLSKKERENLDRKYDYYGASGVIDQVDRYLFDGKYLLIGEDGANLVTRSKPIAFIAEGQYWVNNHAHILSTTDVIIMEFLCYYINSISLLPYVTGSAQPKMTQAKMNTIPILVPPIKEQEIIIEIIHGMITKEEIIKEKAKKVIEQIIIMKKSILSRAFRGELGTNNSDDESAKELLKKIL